MKNILAAMLFIITTVSFAQQYLPTFGEVIYLRSANGSKGIVDE
jgi:hypothetical protein